MVVDISKALSDESRVRALMMLRGRELCVCQLIQLLGLAPSTVSKHMSILRETGLVESRKEGKWMYYRLPDNDAPFYVSKAIRWVQDASANDKQIVQDSLQVDRICTMDRDKLCACYKKSEAEAIETLVKK